MPRCENCGHRAVGAHGCPMPTSAPPAAVTVPGYKTERALGSGGFGVVLAASRGSDGAKVAIKIAHAGLATAREQLARERDALRRIGAPAVPALHDEGTLPSGAPYLVLEHIAAPTLGDLLDAWAGPAPLDRLPSLVLGLTEALAAIHARGFCHLDLKPENAFVLASPPGVRLFDLGLSRDLAATAPAGPPRTYAGTAAYMSPEQWDGTPDLDARADVYAAGVILFELLTGRVPFGGPRGEVQAAHAALRPPRPSAFVPSAGPWDDLVLRCLAKARDARFADGTALRAAVQEVLAGAPASPVRPEAAAVRGAPAQQKRPVGLVYARTSADVGALRAAAEACGGSLAHVGAGRCALVFDADASDRPVRRAVRAAQALVARKLATRALVDLLPVVFQQRRDGPPRIVSASFTRDASYAADTDPEGVLLTSAAGEVMRDVTLTRVRDGISVLGEPQRVAEATVVQGSLSPLLGRDDLLATLLAAAGSVLAGGGPGIATILADPGMGKSHLSAALLQRLRVAHGTIEIVELRAREPVAGEAEETFRALLGRALDLAPQTRLAEAQARVAAVLGPALGAELWPAAGLALGALEARDPAVKSLGAAPGVLRSMAVRAAGEALRRRAAARPLCLVLDDAHWADEASLDALEYAALAEGGAPIWVCVLARPSFGAGRPGFGERAARRDTHRLEALPKERADELCRALLAPADNIPADAIDRLVQRTQGIPLLLVELTRGLKRDGLVRRRQSGETWYLATDELDRLPDLPLIEWLAQRELSALPPDLASHARLAALLGAEFQPEELTSILALLEKRRAAAEFPLDASVATARLQSLGLLVASRHGLLRFRHALVRDAVARSVPETLRGQVHGAARDFYRTASWVPEARRLPHLAFHCAQSGAGEEAAALYLELAERARERHAYLEAERAYTASLDLLAPADGARRLVALRGRGGMRYRTGRYEDALRDLSQARAAARELDHVKAEIDLLLDEATAIDWMNDFPGSALLVEEALQLSRVPGAETPIAKARLALGRGRALLRAGRWHESHAALEEAIALAERLGDDGYETLVIALLLLPVVLPSIGRSADAESAVARVLELSGKRGDQLHFAAAVNNRRNLLIVRKDAPAAIADQRTFMRIGRELGNATFEYFAEFNLGELLYQQGEDLVSAEAHARRSMEIEERHPEVVSRPAGALLVARVLAYQGRNADARQLLGQIATKIAASRREGRAAGELAPAEQVLLEMVGLATSGASAAEWAALEERSARDSIEQEPLEVIDLHGLAARRAGRADEAAGAFARALELGGRIPSLIEDRIRRREPATRAG